MAVNFIARKCACGGRLEYDPGKKVWICQYCGTVVEREATFDRVQVDGIEGITDVVRQTLMDIAYGRLDSAEENLEDCERKNHSHVGTLIANLSYNLSMIAAAGSRDEAEKYLDRSKLYAKRMTEEFPVIAEEEINLYEAFGKDAADIYANLFVVFDTLHDTGRMEYISSKLITGEILSEAANQNLLKIAIKRGKYGTAEEIVKNKNHIDKKYSLQEILYSYPDNDRKTELIDLLFDPRTAEEMGERIFETYFSESKDSLETKTAVIEKLTETQIRYSAETIVRALYAQMDSYQPAFQAFSAIYQRKVSDHETEKILAFFMGENENYDLLTAFLDALIQNKIFVQFNPGITAAFLDRTRFDAEQKMTVLQRMFCFETEEKAMDALYDHYLSRNTDEKETRIKIIDFLLKQSYPVSGNTVKNYVVNSTTDGEQKLQIVDRLFADGINTTYLGDILSDYMLNNVDCETVKEKIEDYLIGKGFKVDGNVLTQYVTFAQIPIETRIDKAKKLIQNGASVKPDCLEHYLLSLTRKTDFSEQMFNLLTDCYFTVGFGAYSRFLLYCRDLDKVRHNSLLMKTFTGDLNALKIAVRHNKNEITCNLLQAYVLIAEDSYDIADAVVRQLLEADVKLNTGIMVNKKTIKFKKYAVDEKAELSPLTTKLCKGNRIFSLF